MCHVVTVVLLMGAGGAAYTAGSTDSTPAASSAPNTAPLPNPWAPSTGGNVQGAAPAGLGGLAGLGGMGGMEGLAGPHLVCSFAVLAAKCTERFSSGSCLDRMRPVIHMLAKQQVAHSPRNSHSSFFSVTQLHCCRHYT